MGASSEPSGKIQGMSDLSGLSIGSMGRILVYRILIMFFIDGCYLSIACVRFIDPSANSPRRRKPIQDSGSAARLQQRISKLFLLGHGRGYLFNKTSRVGSEVAVSLGLKDVDGRPPAVLDYSPSLSQYHLAMLYTEIAAEQFVRHRLHKRSGLRGVASKRRTISPICLAESGRAADRRTGLKIPGRHDELPRL